MQTKILDKIQKDIDLLSDEEQLKLIENLIERQKSNILSRNTEKYLVKDHSAFLKSYAPKDDGLYDEY